MDNDIKIENKKPSRHEDVLLFLNEELNNLQQTENVESYNLEQEYAQTKKHRSPFTIIVLLSCIIVVGLSAFVMTKIINDKNESISVNLQEFNTLNLKSLLDSVSKVQTSYDEAVKAKLELENNKTSELKNAEAKRDSDLYLVDSLNLRNQADVVARKEKALSDYTDTVNKINEEYEPLIAQAQAKIDEIGSQLQQYDASKVEAAREQEKSLDSERKVQELEKQRVADLYEQRINELEQTLIKDRQKNSENMQKAMKELADKYEAEINLLDPTLKDSKAQKIISEAEASEDLSFNGKQILTQDSVDDDTIAQGFEKFQSAYDNYKYIRSPFTAIPYRNSAPDYISTSNKMVDDMSKVFSDTSVTLYNQKVELNGQIEDLKADIVKLNEDHEKEVQELKTQAQENEKSIRSLYETSLIGILDAVKSNAMIISKNGTEVELYIVPAARYLIEGDSTQIEIKGTKAVRGRVTASNQTGYYKFLPPLDKNGEEMEVDYSLIAAGNPVKILAK